MSIILGDKKTIYKVGGANCSIYLGSIKMYPSFEGKYQLTLSDSTTVSAECDATSAITQDEISAYTSTTVAVEIGECVTSIGTNAFRSFSGITSVEIPDSVTSIGANAFRSCTNLASISLPSSVTSIGGGAFRSCTNLASVAIPSSVSGISYEVFSDCVSLTSVTIPSSVTSIDNNAFKRCSGLTSVVIPSGVTRIAFEAFNYCSGLTSITVEAVVPPTLEQNVFNNTNDCPIYVPSESVTAYQTAWSTYASRITTIPNSFVATYSTGATYSELCGSYSTLTSATTKPSGYDYTDMVSAEVGECITNIDATAFNGMSSLSGITFDSTTPPTIAANAFDNTNAMLYVPCSSVGTYRASSNWSSYTDRIVGYESCTTYDWEVVSGEYICQTGDKYEKEKKIRSFDGGTTWEDVIPNVYQAGQLIESGSTDCNLPATFSVNYNAKQYNSSTMTLPKTDGQLVDVDAVFSGSPTIVDNSTSGYITYTGNPSARALLSGYQQYFNRDSASPNLTIVAKARCTGEYLNMHLFANRGDGSTYNWMFRVYSNFVTLHDGNGETGSISISPNSADVFSARVSGSTITYNNWTSGTTSSEEGFSYGTPNNDGASMFNGFAQNEQGQEYFVGDFYWIFIAQDTLTDAQIQNVINYNENL